MGLLKLVCQEQCKRENPEMEDLDLTDCKDVTGDNASFPPSSHQRRGTYSEECLHYTFFR